MRNARLAQMADRVLVGEFPGGLNSRIRREIEHRVSDVMELHFFPGMFRPQHHALVFKSRAREHVTSLPI